MRVCIIYDCLYPYTVGGEERWLRQLAESLVAAGHDVTFLTRLQWSEAPELPGVRVVAVSPRAELYDGRGNRRTLPPLRFGLGVGLFLARHRRDFDVVHTCAFPYFHLPALRLALALTGVPITVDWIEVWSRDYWRRYSGRLAGDLGELVQRICVLLTPTAIVTSSLHGDRLVKLGLRRPAVRPGGLGPDPYGVTPNYSLPEAPTVVFAGRHIREKRADLTIRAAAIARCEIPGLRAVVLGEGPETASVRRSVEECGAQEWASVPGFVAREVVEATLREASVMLLPSEREGFGIVVLEAAAYGTPVVVVAGEDNAAVELIEPGVNGFVAADSSAASVAAELVAAVRAGAALRRSTADWYAGAASGLSSRSTAQALEKLFVELAGQRAPRM